MNAYNTPKKVTWFVCLILGIIALIGVLFGVFPQWVAPVLALIGLGLMLAATKLEGL